MAEQYINDGLVEKLYARMQAGSHIALLGPFGCGKSLIINKIQEKLYSEDPQVDLLRLAFDGTQEKEDRYCLNSICQQLELDYPLPSEMGDGRMSGLLSNILKDAIKPKKKNWIFVKNVMELPTHLARALLEALQEFSMEEKKVSVIVSGTSDFLRMAYGPNSPYRKAEKHIVRYLDRDAFESFVVSRRMGRPIPFPIAERKQQVSKFADPEAIDLLYDETRGYMYLAEQIFLCAFRNYELIEELTSSSPWKLQFVEKLIDSYQRRYLLNDSILANVLRATDESIEHLEQLRDKVNDPDADARIVSPNPTPMQIAGVYSRNSAHQITDIPPMWTRFLSLVLTDRFMGDCYALRGQWKKAWAYYSQADLPRSAGGEPYSRLVQVLSDWENKFTSMISESTEAIVDHLHSGMKCFFGFDKGGFYDGEPDSPPSASSVFEPLTVQEERDLRIACQESKTMEFGSFKIHKTRLRCVSEFKPGDEMAKRPYVLLFRSSQDCFLDTKLTERLKNGLNTFWNCFERARNLDYSQKLYEEQSKIVDKFNDIFVRYRFQGKKLVDKLAEVFVNRQLFFRVQICLINESRTRIQKVASAARDQQDNINFGSNFPVALEGNELLRSNDPDQLVEIENDWHRLGDLDLQQWVVATGKKEEILDATDPHQVNPKTQADRCRLLGMKAISVFPLNVENKVIGTLHLERIDKEPFSIRETTICERIANQLAIVLDQARQTSLLLGAIASMPDTIRIVEPSSLQSVVSNVAEDSNRKPVALEQLKKAIDDSKAQPIEGGRGYHEDSESKSAIEWSYSPIKDFREKTQADPLIGYITAEHDATSLYQLLAATRNWLSDRNVARTIQNVIDYFRDSRRFAWCRLYLCKNQEGAGPLTSTAEFGIADPNLAARFRAGEFLIDARDYLDAGDDGVDQSGDVCIHRFDNSIDAGSRKYSGADRGIPVFLANDSQLRSELKKTDNSWIEVPLKVGKSLIGILCISEPLDGEINPHKWQLLQWTGMAISFAVHSARQAENELASQENRVWKTASAQAAHQLLNRLVAPEVVIDQVCELQLSGFRQELFAAALHDVRMATKIVSDLKRYATSRPFDRNQEFSTRELLNLIVDEIRRLVVEAADGSVSIELIGSIPDCVIKTNLDAVGEIFETIAHNSVKHSKKNDISTLKIEVVAEKLTAVQIQELSLSPTSDWIRLGMSDNGVGIRPSNKKKLFELFWKAEPNSLGSGLGLAIAKDFAVRLGGDIREEGTPHENGALFYLYLPINEPASIDGSTEN